MRESEQVSDLIGAIYDAALDRNLWSPVLEKTCHFLNGHSACLAIQGGTHIQFCLEWGHDPKFLESLHSTYAAINPLYVPVLTYSKLGEVRTISDFVPVEEFHASRFYREWVAPQNLDDALFGLFDKTAASHAGLSVIKSAAAGAVSQENKRRFGLLYPHFRRAVTIARIIDLHKFEAAAFADSIDGLAIAMFLVDARGRPTYINAPGQAMLDKSDVVRIAGGRLVALDARADSILRDIFVNAANGDGAVNTKGIDVPLAACDGGRYVAHVLPLTSGARRKAGTAYSAVAAVFVRKAELELPHPLETIASAFKLTSAEMRVLMMIVQLGGIREVAPVLGISESTVKTHLQHVFEKTNTGRQAELVKLVAGYMNPLGAWP